MMILYEFIRLNQAQRALAVWDRGQLLMVCPDGCQLYRIGPFFVEVAFCAQQRKVVHVRGFTSSRPLEHYIKHIKLPESFYY